MLRSNKVEALLSNQIAGPHYDAKNLTFIPGEAKEFSVPRQNRFVTNLIQRRTYSTLPSNSKGVKYNNADKDKITILSENKGKAGVYMWTHIESGKRYVGSSVNLRRRFLEYFNTERLIKDASMVINRGLLKYGYSAFSLEVLVYCDRSELMVQEKCYIDVLNPEWNILKVPGSPSRGSGWKHTAETLSFMQVQYWTCMKEKKWGRFKKTDLLKFVWLCRKLNFQTKY